MEWALQNGFYVASGSGFSLSAVAENVAAGVEVFAGENHILTAYSVDDSELIPQSNSAYCRGRDLFSAFQGESHVVECYWRIGQLSDQAIGIESIISLRSMLLETEELKFSQWIKGLSENFEAHPSLQDAYINPTASISVALMVHPLDSSETRIEHRPGQIRISTSSPLMERGVIRRFRVLQPIWNCQVSESDYESVQIQFAESAIPLTT